RPQDAASRAIAGTPAGRAETFSFVVPTDATPGGTIRIDASAIDTFGHVSNAAPILVTVLDAVPPTVRIASATTGQKVSPAQQVTAVVSAEDAGRVASVTIRVSGVTTAAATRTIDPPQSNVATSLTFTVPANARATDVVNLDATAVDVAGNTA